MEGTAERSNFGAAATFVHPLTRKLFMRRDFTGTVAFFSLHDNFTAWPFFPAVNIQSRVSTTFNPESKMSSRHLEISFSATIKSKKYFKLMDLKSDNIWISLLFIKASVTKTFFQLFSLPTFPWQHLQMSKRASGGCRRVAAQRQHNGLRSAVTAEHRRFHILTANNEKQVSC